MKVFIRIVISLFVIIGLAMGAMLFFGPGSLNAKNGDSREVLAGGSSRAKKALIVYQAARTGSTRRVALDIGERLGKAGYLVELNRPGAHMPKDLSTYSIVAFGSPVYAGKISPVLVDYVKTVRGLPVGKVVIFSVGGVDDDGPELAPLKAVLGDVEPALALKLNVKADWNGGKYDAVYGLAVH